MKMLQKSIAALAIASFAIVPITAMAQEDDGLTREERREAKRKEIEDRREERKEDREDRKANKICERMSNSMNRLEEIIANKKEKIQERVTNKEEKVTARIERAIENRDNKRENADAKREERYSKLEDRAQTEEQKVAVVEFKTEVEAAIDVMRTAKDQAISDFKSAVEALHKEREQQRERNRENFETAVKVAHEKAKTDCAQEDADAAVIRQTLKDNISAAKEEFKKGKVEYEGEMKALIATKKAAFEQANTTFQVAVKAAKDELMTVFGGDDETEGEE